MSEKKEYIERGALLEKAKDFQYKHWNGTINVFIGTGVSVSDVQSIPAADVEPVVRKHWEWFCEIDSTTNGYEEDYGWRCSGCRAKLTDFIADGDVRDEYPVRMRHCPNCGAHMERSGSGE